MIRLGHAFAAGALALVACAPASAADMALKGPPAAVGFNWTGCYVGGHIGWIGGADRLTSGFAPDGFLVPAQIAGSSNSYTPHGNGFTGGGEFGCNWQPVASALVWGMEADISGTTLRETASGGYPDRFLAGPFPQIQTAHTEVLRKNLDWFSTIRARAGYARDRLLVYATGGIAVGEIGSSIAYQPVIAGFPIPVVPGSARSTRAGWTAGAGFEYAFNGNWSAKAEYLYLDFGKFSYLTVPLNDIRAEVDAREHVVRLGLNYRFSGSR